VRFEVNVDKVTHPNIDPIDGPIMVDEQKDRNAIRSLSTLREQIQDVPALDVPLEIPKPIESDQPVIVDPIREPSNRIVKLPHTTLVWRRSDIRLALTSREPKTKEQLLKSSGGTTKTEDAVELGLHWLKKRQFRNGLWSLTQPYSDGSQFENPAAATAMALLAFQGAGYTPDGAGHQFTPVVRRGGEALLKLDDGNGRFFQNVAHAHQLYTQAQCTIALCELYGMTGDARYRVAAEKAVAICLEAQSTAGGWRYSPGEQGDLSVTGWFVTALQSARMADIEVPSDVFERIEGFIDSVAREEGTRYAYRPTESATLALTAEGLLCRQYLGWPHDDPRFNRGVEYLLENLPDWEQRDVYYWYYATQVLRHLEDERWRTWNDVMRELLPEHQIKRGPERGSWNPKGDRWGDQGGRLYVTCLSLYILEAYYRYLPIYTK
jgi:hypothetical protein